MRTNLDEIFAFIAVVDAGSFSGGGQAIGLTRSAVGKAVTRLETRLGVRLLYRTTRKMSVTDDGRVFYEHCSRVVSLLEETEASVGQKSAIPTGLLRLTVPEGFGRTHVLPSLQRYMEEWPDLQVDVNFSDRIADMVEDGFDLAVRIGTSGTDTRLISRVVAEHKSIICASPAYLDRRGRAEIPDDLASHDCLSFKSGSSKQPWRLREIDGTWSTVGGRGRLRLDSGEAIRDAAIAGMGVAYLPSFLVKEAIADRRLEPILTAFETQTIPIIVVYPSKRYLSAKVRRFIDLMADEWAYTRIASGDVKD
ncbi:LysR family transcriptional regulator (plasmid) [Agrobacterium sp. rho-13.3]|jgi:DNA-binding transcriptional LysR family regulator|uniref:LysR family transcriptional regulator n=1 Tax=Agrobacterium sp. rho-13.3 TaxID=3072980 RepID=UPI002A177DDC|nr:LysR family transcriptional regulator [Agrobacterium sp. rho-13.3]MDX8311584.1 LysR family transcriptional regulator [Agrobacterium sp. rho-13.3]